MKILLSILTSLILTGCGVVNFNPGKSAAFISGKIPSLQGIVYNPSVFSIIQEAAAIQCDSDIYARLYEIQTDGTLAANAIASQKLETNTYFFDLEALKLSLSEKISYQVEVEGCEERLARPVTNYGDNQDVTLSSTIIGLVTVGHTTISLSQAKRAEVEKLINSFNGTNLYNAYQNLDTNAEAKNLFQAVFLDTPEVILDAKPKLTFVNIPSLLSEGISSQFKVGAFHVDPNYHFAYEWRLDSTTKNSTSTWNFSPTANESGTYNITLYVGQDDGTGHVNTAKPYHVINSIIMVADTIPATPIDFTPSSALTNDVNITLSLDTGFSLSNCESFSSIAITENLTGIPGAGLFTTTCSQSPVQTKAFNLSSGDGVKTLRLWVKDSAGKISAGPITKTVTLDQTAPVATIASVPSLLKGGSTLAVSFSLSDSSAVSANLYYNNTLVSALSGTSYNWTVPSDNTTSAKLKIIATDALGNSTTIESNPFTIDSLAPSAPVASLTSSAITDSIVQNITLASCSDFAGIFISESSTAPAALDANWQPCITNLTYSLSSSVNGGRTVYLYSRDAAGNVSVSSSINMIYDNVAPVLAITSSVNSVAGGSVYNLNWTLTEMNASATQTFSIEIYNGASWVAHSTHSVTNGPHTVRAFSKSITLPYLNTASAMIKVSYTDLAGQSASAETSAFTVDSSAPIINALTLNNGNVNSFSSTIKVALQASDDLTKISHFCLKYTTGITVPTAPVASDPCWVAVNAPLPGITPDKNINFSNFFYSLGILSAQYNAFAWTKNELGLISTLSNGGQGTLGSDYFLVNYKAGVPPTLINVTSSKMDNLSLAVSTANLNVTAGTPIYVKWRATDDDVLPTGSIAVSYTLNETSYTTIATGLSNISNNGCSVDGTNYTGCFATTAPSSAYFKIKVSISDSSNMTSISNAIPNNMASFNILAGNTEAGIGGSASSAIFNLDLGSTLTNIPGSLVVSDSGVFYIRDMVNGILKIDPSDGIVKQLVPVAGSRTNGPIGTATMQHRTAFMTIDYQGNLLFFDADRIRKVNLVTNTVSTLIGGGSIRASNTDATSFQVMSCQTTKYCPITALPNGDIYFSDNPITTGEKLIWKYEASSGKVFSITASGSGISGRPALDDVSSSSYKMTAFSIAFDVTNSNITKTILQLMPDPCPGCGAAGYTAFLDISSGNTIPSPTPAAFPSGGGVYSFKSSPTAKDGHIYFLGQESTYMMARFNEANNTWTKILGTGNSGFCEDGTDALSCDVFAMDAFVTADSRIFFISNGLIRTIDANNKVQTLFGQRRTFGDTGLATSARINSVPFFDFFSNGDIVFFDANESIIRSFAPGGNVTRIAGNGTTTTVHGSLATETGISGMWWGAKNQMVVNPTTDDIYLTNGSRLSQIKKLDNKIYNVISGSTVYSSADNLPGSQINISPNEPAGLLGIRNGQLLLSMSQRNPAVPGENFKCYMKFYDSTNNFTQSHFAGNNNVCTNTYPTNGANTTDADVGLAASNVQLMAEWFPDHGAWIIPRSFTPVLKSYTPGGTVQTVVTLPRTINSFTILKNVSNQNVVYYCGTGGRIYKYNMTTAIETALPWPGSTYACTGFKIKYHTARGSIVFPYLKSGLAGIAEISDTP